MGWNYRIVRVQSLPSAYYKILEVYYGDDGVPHSWADRSSVGGDSLEEIIEAVGLMQLAFSKPVLYIQGDKIYEQDPLNNEKDQQSTSDEGT